jgi:hypothetical protein
MTEREAKDFIEQSLKYGREFIDADNGFSYSFEMGDGYVSVKRNDGYVINASFHCLKKYSVKFDWDKNITSVIHVVGIDHNGEWQGWKIYVRCAEVSPIQQQRKMCEMQRAFNFRKLLVDNRNKFEELHDKVVFAEKELPNAEITYENMYTEFWTKFTENERKRELHHLQEWRDYVVRLKNVKKEYDDFINELWEIASEGLEVY